MASPPFLSRQSRFAVVGSTNDIVRGWLEAGEAEVCLAVADEQVSGRGRQGRSWSAPPGRALLLSLGFRPTWLTPDRTWQLNALISLAMADAGEEVAGLAEGSIRLKWPNDLVIEDGEAPAGADRQAAGTGADDVREGDRSKALTTAYRKLAGVLGETSGLGGPNPIAIVGIGVNADWPADEFPPDLVATMTSLREASHGRPIDLALLLDAFLGRLEVRLAALRAGRFDVADWTARQLVSGRTVLLEHPDGVVETVRALGADPRSGALLVADAAAPGGERQVVSGEVRRVRLAPVEV